ncbi:MAG: hypothetical protein ACP5P3_04995 [Ignavibacteria bacterium]
MSVPQSEHFQPNGMMILNESLSDTLMYYFNGQLLYDKDTLFAPYNALGGHWIVKFLDANQNRLEPPSDPDHSLGWLISDPTKLEVYQHGGDKWAFHLRGKAVGITSIKFQVMHVGHADFTTIFVPVRIDTTTIGEIGGLKLYLEENDSLLVKDSAGVITGSLNLSVNDTLGHIVVKFLDILGNQFEYDPPSPPYSLGYILGNTGIAEFEPGGISEPYAFLIIGRSVGTTTLKLRLLNSNIPEFESGLINLYVHN